VLHPVITSHGVLSEKPRTGEPTRPAALPPCRSAPGLPSFFRYRRRGVFGFRSPREKLRHVPGIRSRWLPLTGSGIWYFIASGGNGKRRGGSGAGLSEKSFISDILPVFGLFGAIEILISPNGDIPKGIYPLPG